MPYTVLQPTMFMQIVDLKRTLDTGVLSNFPRETAEQRYTADTFERMFAYYNRHGLTWNSNVLRWLLGRSPAGFPEYFQRALATDLTSSPGTLHAVDSLL